MALTRTGEANMTDLTARELERHRTRTDCAWCATVFDKVIDLLTHVESCHLGDPEPDFDAAA